MKHIFCLNVLLSVLRSCEVHDQQDVDVDNGVERGEDATLTSRSGSALAYGVISSICAHEWSGSLAIYGAHPILSLSCRISAFPHQDLKI